jgi:dipeptidyl aminopeptidase/acylaminoacyl peptidase
MRKLEMARSRERHFFFSVLLVCAIHAPLNSQTKPKLTLDDFFKWVEIKDVKVSPAGNSVLIATERADWEQQIFRNELWLYRISTGAATNTSDSSGGLVQLTQSGHDKDAQWSPDGKWIAFLSERKGSTGKGEGPADEGGDDDKGKEDAQIYLISPNGGEAFAVTSGNEEVHAFGWDADSKALYFATREPWSKQQTDDHKKDWKDAVRYRGDERGDVIFRIGLDDALARHATLGAREVPDAEEDSNSTPGATAVTRTTLRIDQLCISPDGRRLAFLSNSVSQRQEAADEVEIYLVSLIGSAAEVVPARLTRNEAVELNLEWAPDSRHLFFQINLGSVEKKYEDAEPRLYWVDAESGAVRRWFADFQGEVVKYAALPDGSVLCACHQRTEIQLYSQASPTAASVKREGWAGSYAAPASALRSPRVAFVHSATERPNEVYIADGPDKIAQARPITTFNKLFTERDLPKAKPYHWTAPDGTPIEGMLMYPPGKFEARNLPTFVYIHGGPQEAAGSYFEADWYVWDRLAATQGWLVFEPSYRGSTGYGDKFALAVSPHAFSAPGQDILSGVDALVKDGISDANHLAVGGYSYGGYMTNWLITQTTRFKAAVTGAGGVENVADWGNDDSTFDDTWFLGGTPWDARENYDSEAAIFQINKVRTPTHMVAGADDIRVPTLEDYLLDRALHQLGVPSDLLLFPGEGHDLGKNPWHGKIKVREELKWLEKYGGVGTN